MKRILALSLLLTMMTGCMSFSDRGMRPVRNSISEQMPEIRLEKQRNRHAFVAGLLAEGKTVREIMAACGSHINTARKDIVAARKQMEAKG